MTSPDPLPPVNLMMSALWWAGKGIPVLPLHYPRDKACSCGDTDCQNAAKHPMSRLVPRGLNDASTDVQLVRDWWVQQPYANIGIRTGDIVDLLDIDSDEGLAAFGNACRRAGGQPHHLGMASTGRAGGVHLYVVPGGQRALTGGRTAPAGIDVKGRGGYAVAPPSLHLSGRRYTWVANTFDTGTVEGDVAWPDFYDSLVIRPTHTPRGPSPTTRIPADAADAYGQAVLARAVNLVLATAPGHRWQTLATEAIPLIARGVDGGCIDRDSGVRELEEASRSVGLDNQEIRRVGLLVDDMIARGIRHPIRPRESAGIAGLVAQHATEDEARADPWEPPWPLRYPTPPFPVEVMGWMTPAVKALASQLQCPVDLIAMMTLATISATIRGRIRAQFIDDWQEPLNLYVAAVLGPGETKSPALSRIVAPLREMENEARAYMKDHILGAQFNKDLLHERARKLRDAAVKATGDSYERLSTQDDAREAALAADQVVVPPVPLWLAGDMTPEALVAKLAEQGGALAHLSAEGELLDTIVGGRYSSGAPHLSALLTAHDGREPVRVHRKGAADVEVPDPCLTLGLAVQPQVLEAMGAVDAAVRRGLAARFLFSVPMSLVGHRDMTVQRSEPSSQPFDVLLRAVDALAGASEGFGYKGPSEGQSSQVSDLHEQGPGDFGPSSLGIASGGEVSPGSGDSGQKSLKYEFKGSSSSLVTHYRESLEPRRAAQTGDLGEIGPWANKLDGQIIRLATVLQILHDVDPAVSTHGSSTQNTQPARVVGVEATSSALLLADYLISHAIEAHAIMGGAEATTEYARAKQLLGWVESNGHTEFTAHEAERSLRKRVTFREQGSINAACTTLARLGWIRFMPEEPRTGRPSARYLVHPEVHQR